MRLAPGSRSRLVIAGTFVVAMILSILPGPTWAEPFRPDWVALVLIYWCMALPDRVSVGAGFLAGVILDVLYGALLGQHALAKTLLAYVAVRSHLQLRMFPRMQQAAVVLVLMLGNHLIMLWVKHLAGGVSVAWTYWTPSIVAMVLWPWFFTVLRDIRRRGHVN